MVESVVDSACEGWVLQEHRPGNDLSRTCMPAAMLLQGRRPTPDSGHAGEVLAWQAKRGWHCRCVASARFSPPGKRLRSQQPPCRVSGSNRRHLATFVSGFKEQYRWNESAHRHLDTPAFLPACKVGGRHRCPCLLGRAFRSLTRRCQRESRVIRLLNPALWHQDSRCDNTQCRRSRKATARPIHGSSIRE